jgi:hypothetical protein
VEARFQLNTTVEKAYSLIFKTIRELGISDLAIIREIPTPRGSSPRKPSCVLLQYTRGQLGLDERQTELSFGDKQIMKEEDVLGKEGRG